MPQPSLADLTSVAAQKDGPSVTPANTLKLGGVDPLGLRQINFDLMDQVFPGLNNVARHIRPFVVVAWSWRRAKQIAETHELDRVPIDDLRDFVDRIEVIYAWSQFLRNPDADLPGRQVLAVLVQSDSWTFGGPSWRERRKVRRYSTAFTAPITYGPALKALGWVEPHQEHSDVLVPTAAAAPALDAFEAQITDRLGHRAFSQFGSVEVRAEEASAWADAWALERVTEAEQRVAAEMLFGFAAPIARRRGGNLMIAAASHALTSDVAQVRSTMAGTPSNFAPRPDLEDAFQAWRRVQVRQLFRLSLEALLYWIMIQLDGGAKRTDVLVGAFLDQAISRPERETTREWLDAGSLATTGPTVFMDRIEAALNAASQNGLASSIADALAFCLEEAPEQGQVFERADRLPLFRARHEAAAWGQASTRAFVRHVLESWVLAQHCYWSVGRGLADARAQGKTLLRLKIVLEEGGWTLTPGALRGSPPAPTPDRLQSALSLAQECGLLVDLPA